MEYASDFTGKRDYFLMQSRVRLACSHPRGVEGDNTNVVSGWGRAKKEASAQLAEMRVRTARLKAAIKLFTEKEKDGEPWPLAETTAKTG
jgi:predicted DNA-binding WGR domain protein